jgi:hypothetical protein
LGEGDEDRRRLLRDDGRAATAEELRDGDRDDQQQAEKDRQRREQGSQPIRSNGSDAAESPTRPDLNRNAKSESGKGRQQLVGIEFLNSALSHSRGNRRRRRPTMPTR